MKGYVLYFDTIKTNEFYREHWIEKHAKVKLNLKSIKHNWIQVVGTRKTIIGVGRGHQRAPEIYAIKDFNKEQTVEFYRIEDIDGFVKSIINGTELEREKLLN